MFRFETRALWAFQRERDYQRPHLPEKSVTPGCWLLLCFRTWFCTWKLQHYAKSCEESWRCREWAFLFPYLAGESKPKACLKKYFAQATCNGPAKQAFIIDSLHHATRSPSRWRNHFPSRLMLLFYAVVRNWLIATFGQSRESEQ